MKEIKGEVIDAEFVDIVEETRRDPRLLEEAANLVEKVARPFDRLPGGKRHAEKMREAAVEIRALDGELQAIEPIAERIGKRIKNFVNLNPEREVLPR